MQHTASGFTESPPVPVRAYVAYFLVGASILFLCLFPPASLSRFASQLAWNPAAGGLKFSSKEPTPTATMAPDELRGKAAPTSACYAWSNLSEENAQQAKGLLAGNTSVSGVQTVANPGKVGLAVVMPADLTKRTVLTKILADNKVDVANVITLSNGNRAWAVGVFTAESMAMQAKSDLMAKGAWNVVTESRSPTTSIQFSTANPAIADTLNAFAKQHEWPALSACQ